MELQLSETCPLTGPVTVTESETIYRAANRGSKKALEALETEDGKVD